MDKYEIWNRISQECTGTKNILYTIPVFTTDCGKISGGYLFSISENKTIYILNNTLKQQKPNRIIRKWEIKKITIRECKYLGILCNFIFGLLLFSIITKELENTYWILAPVCILISMIPLFIIRQKKIIIYTNQEKLKYKFGYFIFGKRKKKVIDFMNYVIQFANQLNQ